MSYKIECIKCNSTGDNSMYQGYVGGYIKKVITGSIYNRYDEDDGWARTATSWPVYGESSIYKAASTCNYINTWGDYNSGSPGWNTARMPIPAPLPLSERFRQILQARRTPTFLLSRTPIKLAADERELRARETLRRMLGDDGFRRFLRNGFVSVRANSGKVYQIYPGHGMTIVYNQGTPVEKLCVVLRGDFTPTDSLITRYVMILHDEQHFRGLANVFQASPRSRTQPVIDMRSLPQILQSLKVAA